MTALTERATPRVDIAFLMLASACLIVGVCLGIYMGVNEDFQLVAVHTHVNLVGWVSLALFGVIYRNYPVLAASRLARSFLASRSKRSGISSRTLPDAGAPDPHRGDGGVAALAVGCAGVLRGGGGTGIVEVVESVTWRNPLCLFLIKLEDRMADQSPFSASIIHHLGLRVEHAEAGKRSLTTMLGFRVEREFQFAGHDFVVLSAGGAKSPVIEHIGGPLGNERQIPENIPDMLKLAGWKHICLQVCNIEECMAYLRRRGVRVLIDVIVRNQDDSHRRPLGQRLRAN
jgi:catechol 2,3-dioxygenase-like lactoylglutathione lyase family enzyme